ncbi:MAG TPA: hypothetical protein VI524_15635 [Anaerolineales bacterium]|nr:hypothetical protein [Anaerolineales bacterium]
MKNLLRKIESPQSSPYGVPAMLFLMAVLVYGLFFWQMGFYWDDLPISWIRYQFGAEAMRVYFSTSRPVWGELYQLTTRLLPQVPAYWQSFAIVWRWLGVVVLWMILRILWPQRRGMAIVASCLFLLYPGFNQQWVSFLSSHFFIVLFFFLFSYLLMLWSFLYPKWFWPLTLLAVIFSGLNLWMMEYFFGLELIRPFVILFFSVQYSEANARRPVQKAILAALKRWLPYLVVFLANVFYRMFVFTNLAYENVLLSDLRANPVRAVLNLLREVISDLWIVFVQAWGRTLYLPTPGAEGWLTTIFYLAVVLITGLLIVLFRARGEGMDRRAAWWGIGLGLVAMVVGGAPYWLAQLEVTLGFPANRFTLSFVLGASLFLAGLLELFPARARLVLSVALVALAAGRQALWLETFRRDWATQKNMFWQLAWRAPDLSPDTIVMMNEGALNYYADNSLGAALNWIYAPDNQSKQIPYAFFFPKSRLGGTLAGLEPGLAVEYTFLIGGFSGSTSQMAAFYYQPPGCLRLLDPEIDPFNRLIPVDSLMRAAASLSSSAPILDQPAARMPEIYGPEPSHGWCYYFEKAELARQSGDWQKIMELGDAALKSGDHPNDPVERFVFIEGYAHAGEWDRAIKLSQESYRVSKEYVGPLLCRLWDRIETETTEGTERSASLDTIRDMLACPG